jgi:tetratricopeptide (TPR) repeat protein
LVSGCPPPVTELAESDPESIITRKSELLKGENIPEETVLAIINAHNNIGNNALDKGDYITAETQFNEALKLNIKNNHAKCGLAMISGHHFFKKGSEAALWDALEQYSKAAHYEPTNGEAHYWIGRTYEKKDEGDFELIIEAYQKALKGNLPTDRFTDAEQRLNSVLKRQKTYEDFWK